MYYGIFSLLTACLVTAALLKTLFTEARSSAFASASMKEVSGQSAFWALVPIALNSMTQPAGSVFAFPSVHGEFGLRVSPLVCVCDALHFITYLARHTISTRSPRQAMMLTLKPRFPNRNTGERSSAASLQQNVIFRLALFMLGSLPQIIKLFCMRGIPVTTTIASFYFGSFLVLEIGVYFSPDLEQDIEAGNGINDSVYSGNNIREHLGWKLRHSVIPLGLVILFYPFALSAYEIAPLVGHHFWLYVLGFCILTLLPVIHTVWLKGDKVTVTETLMLFPIMIGAFLSSCLLLSISDRARSADSRMILGLWISAGLFVMMGIGSNHIYWISSMNRLDVQSKKIGIGWSSFMVSYHLSTALLCYSFRYDPSGTSKPLWVNQLG